jgi:hypothetical protein
MWFCAYCAVLPGWHAQWQEFSVPQQCVITDATRMIHLLWQVAVGESARLLLTACQCAVEVNRQASSAVLSDLNRQEASPAVLFCCVLSKLVAPGTKFFPLQHNLKGRKRWLLTGD